jgi:hypothetical protein
MSACPPTSVIWTACSDSLFHQLTNIQGSDEANENGQKKDLTITGDIFKICMLLASITEVGESGILLCPNTEFDLKYCHSEKATL